MKPQAKTSGGSHIALPVYCSALVLAALLAFGMGAPSASPVQAVPPAPSHEAISSPQAPVQQVLPLGDDLFAGRVLVGGVVYALPCPLAHFLDAGWATRADTSESLAPGEMAELLLTKDGARVPVQLANTLETAQPLAACNVAGLALGGAGGPAFMLPGGIGPGAAKDALLALGGTPDAGTAGNALRYTTGRHSHLVFGLDAAGALQSVKLWKLYPQPAAPKASTLPAEVPAREAPTALGEDWQSFTVEYGGALYALPAPVAAFLAEGWTLRDEGTLPAGGWLMRVCLQKGTQVLRTTLRNYSSSAQPLAACFVTMVESSALGADIPLQLPGGVGIGSSLEDFEAAWGEAHMVDRTGLATRDYYYNGGSGCVILRYQRETERIVEIEVWNEPETLE